MRKSYPSDISREQFELLRPLLESARRKTSPRKVDLYDVFCGVLYLLRTGVSLLEQALKKSGWRDPRETGAQRLKRVLDLGRTEREEREYGGSEGL